MNAIKGLTLTLLIVFFCSPLLAQALELPEVEKVEVVSEALTWQDLVARLPANASLDDPNLILVNRSNRISEDMVMDFAMTGSGHYYNARIEDDFGRLIDAAGLAGYSYQTVSAYRTIAYQEANFQARYQLYINDGYSHDDALYQTSLFVAPADATEHATGLAFDLLGYDYQEYGRDLHQVYGQYPSAIWLENHAHEYGFVIRFQEGKQWATGYEYEPWHIRYVGVENARFMHEYQLSLEEYLSLIAYRDRASNV